MATGERSAEGIRCLLHHSQKTKASLSKNIPVLPGLPPQAEGFHRLRAEGLPGQRHPQRGGEPHHVISHSPTKHKKGHVPAPS